MPALGAVASIHRTSESLYCRKHKWSYPLSKERRFWNIEGYLQQIEYHYNHPPNHTTYGANKYGDEVNGNRRREKEVRKEQQ